MPARTAARAPLRPVMTAGTGHVRPLLHHRRGREAQLGGVTLYLTRLTPLQHHAVLQRRLRGIDLVICHYRVVEQYRLGQELAVRSVPGGANARGEHLIRADTAQRQAYRAAQLVADSERSGGRPVRAGRPSLGPLGGCELGGGDVPDPAGAWPVAVEVTCDEWCAAGVA